VPAILAIDLGTSRIRAGLYDEGGGCLAVSAFEYPLLAPTPGAAEQRPALWVEGFNKTVKEVLSKVGNVSIEGLTFSGQMHGTVLMGRDGQPLADAIIWCDQRGGEAVQWIYQEIGRERHGEITGNPLATGFQAATLGFLRRKSPDLLVKCAQVLLPKDYLISVLTGQYVTEPTDAVSTSLLDLDLPDGRNPHWSGMLINLLGLSIDQFPRILTSLNPAGLSLSAEAAECVGLPSGLPILATGGDAVLGATLAMGGGRVDDAIGLISSGGQLLVSRSRPVACPAQGVHLLPQLEPGLWFNMAAFLAAGLSLEWWRETLETWAGKEVSIENILESALAVPVGSDGLCFLPHIAGERTPLLDPGARGVFWGIERHHGFGHFTRAILEGVAFSFRWGLEILESEGGKVHSLALGGGGVKSPLWCQTFADALGRELQTLAGISETSLTGAALAGARALGWNTSSWYPERGDSFHPAASHHSVLQNGYRQFLRLAPYLKEIRP
jgi:xylulokinase